MVEVQPDGITLDYLHFSAQHSPVAELDMAFQKGERMGFIKYINFGGLTDKQRKELQKLLEGEKRELADLLSKTNQGLAMLKKKPAKKKAKKAKKGRKGGR